MSELSHVERVDHADTVQNADHIEHLTVENAEHVGRLTINAPAATDAQTKAKSKIDRLYVAAAILVLFAVVLSLGLCTYFVRARSSDQEGFQRSQQIANEKIDELTKQLASASAVTLKELQTSNDKKDCAAGYARSVALASAKYVQAVGQLSVAIALFPPGSPERVSASAKGLTAVNATDVAQQAAFDAQSAYFTNGEPLPCDPKVLAS